MPSKERLYTVKEIGKKFHITFIRTGRRTGYVFNTQDSAQSFLNQMIGYPFKNREGEH
jgi:hypothetical protein